MRLASRSLDAVSRPPDEDDGLAAEQPLTGWVLSTRQDPSDSAASPSATWLHVGDKPMPLRIEDFFADTEQVFDHTVVFWDPQCLWASNALDRLTSASAGPLGTTKLCVEHQADALAVVHHRWLTTDDAQTIGMVHIQDRPGASVRELDVPLGIVESSSVAAIVLGGGKDRDVDHRLTAFCELAAWRGPVVHALHVRGKAGARGRNKRVLWPRSIRTRSVFYDPGPVPSSLLSALQLMAPKMLFGAAVGDSTDSMGECGRARPGSVASPSHTCHPTRMNSTSVNPADSVPKVTVSSAAVSTPVERGLSDDLLACARLSPGVLAVLVVDLLGDHPALHAASDEELAAKHLERLQIWLRQTTTPSPVDASPVESVSQVMDDSMLCVATALPGQPRRFLVALGDSSRVTPRRLTWQLRVAANSL